MNRRSMRPALRGAVAAMLSLAGLGLAPRSAAAQDPLAGPPVQAPPLPGEELLLDAPVSRTEYLLGPGDVVTVSIAGGVNRLWNLPVTPDGALVVPEMGLVRVLGLNLEQAQSRVRAVVSRYYQGVSVELALSAARRFKVFVVGDVPAPGARVATPATRVSEVVPPREAPRTEGPAAGESARSDSARAARTGAEAPPPATVTRRNVLVRRAEGDSVWADLARFRQTGDLSANPTLRQGDVVVVPTADRVVQVYGRVRFPGAYEYREGETLGELLSIANGSAGFPENAADTVRLSRFDERGERQFFSFSREEAVGARGRAFALRPSDAVYVSELGNFHLQRTATVTGQVMRPGTYPIRPDTTTVRELVALAGGFTPEASLVEATLRRTADSAQAAAGTTQLERVPPELLSDDQRRLLQTRALADPTVVVLDFQQLFAGGENALDRAVEANDVLSVPRRRSGVTVVGAVAQPGIVQYSPGLSVGDYVRRAGGYSRRADRGDVTVLRARAGARADARDVSRVEAGDQIVVPFRRRRDPLQTLQVVSTVVTTVSGLIFTYLTLERVLFPDK